MMSSARKVVALAVSFLLMLGVCQVTFAAALAESKPITITVWCWDEFYNVAIMKKAAELYTRDHPEVTIDVQDVSPTDIDMKLNTNLSSGSADGLPDVCLIADMNYSKFIKTYTSLFLDTTNDFPYDKFAESKLSYITLDGKRYGLPFDSGIGGMFYRSDYFEQAGISEDSLKDITWDQFIELGKQVQEKTGKALTFLDMSDLGGLVDFTFLQSAGVGIYNGGQLSIKDNGALKVALETARKLYDSGAVKIANGWEESVGSVNKGDVASVVTGAWYIGTIKQAQDQSGKWKVAPAPRLDYEGSMTVLDTTGCTWALFSGKPNNAETIKFLNAIYAGNDEFYGSILLNQGAIGSYIPSLDINEYNNPDPFFGNQPIFKTFAEQLPLVKPIDLGGYASELANAVTQGLTEYLNGSMDIDQAMEHIENVFTTMVG